MKADTQLALDRLACTIQKAVQTFMDETEHEYVPEFEFSFTDVSVIGKREFQPIVTATASEKLSSRV